MRLWFQRSSCKGSFILDYPSNCENEIEELCHESVADYFVSSSREWSFLAFSSERISTENINGSLNVVEFPASNYFLVVKGFLQKTNFVSADS